MFERVVEGWFVLLRFMGLVTGQELTVKERGFLLLLLIKIVLTIGGCFSCSRAQLEESRMHEMPTQIPIPLSPLITKTVPFLLISP